MAKRKLIVEIVGDSRSLEKSLGRASASARRFSVGFGSIAKATVGFTAITAGLDAVGNAIRGSVAEFSEQQKVVAQTEAVLKSTGNAANVTARQVDKLSESIARYSGIDDEAVAAGENLLLTFPKIRNEVGKGNRIFDQATRTVVDLSVALGKSIPTASVLVGKALNDPVRGLTALRRVGVQFTAAQEKMIKGFVKTGQTIKAQKLILAELNREFGGSAKALGNTIPGKLNRLRETLRNVGGELIGKLAPAFSSALESALAFADGLGKAKGIKAKFEFVLDGAQTLARDLFRQLEDALKRVDFSQVVASVQQQIATGLTRIGEFLGRVDFREVGRVLGDALVRGVQGAAAFLSGVDWGVVGDRIVKGIGDFLRGVNWTALFKGVYRLIVAANVAVSSVLVGAGKAIGRGFANAIGEGLSSLKDVVVKKAYEVVLAVADALDFSLPGIGTIIPGVESLKKNITSRLEEIAKKAEETAGRIKAASATIAQAGNPGVRGTAGQRATATATRTTTATGGALEAATTAGKQADAAKTAAEKAAAAARKAREAFDLLLDGLQLRVEKSGVTAGLQDDLVALRKVEKALRDRLKIEKNSVDLQRQLFQTQQEIKGVRSQQADANQFKQLGLTATGDQRVPGVASLRKSLSSVSTAVKGSFLDTSKTRGLLANIRKVLSGGLGAISSDVRGKIKELLDGIDSDLRGRQQGSLTKFKVVNTDKVLAGLGLSGDVLREARARLAQLGPGGTVPGVGRSAFGVPVTGPAGLTISGPITVVADNPDAFLRELQKKGRRGTSSTRGPFAGTNLGLG